MDNSQNDSKKPETKLVNPPSKQTKMVRIKTLLPIRRQVGPTPLDTEIVNPGTTLEVTEDEAKMFCDKSFKGLPKFSGERYEGDGDVEFHRIYRAKRLTDDKAG